jgi:hypothetical protein
MIKGRLWRFLVLFFALYVVFLFVFFRSFYSDNNETTTSPSPQTHVIKNDNQEQINIDHHVAVREVEIDNKNVQSNLEPFMTKGILGNYETKNLVKSSGPGEDGEGVQLQGEDIKLGEQSVSEYGFNEVASEKISLDRRARDTR